MNTNEFQNETRTIISENYGIKIIDPIIGEKDYPEKRVRSHQRDKFAQKCANELGITPVPEIVKELAVKYSDIPNICIKNMYADPNVVPSLQERTLLGMKCVFVHDGLANFIDYDGHTYLIPANDVILNELEKCGYAVLLSSSTLDGNVTIRQNETYKSVPKDEIRAQLTISPELCAEMEETESLNAAVHVRPYNETLEEELPLPRWAKPQNIEGTDLIKATFAYDVFDNRIECFQPGYEDFSVNYTYDFLGHNNKTAQKMKAMTDISANKAEIIDPNGYKQTIFIDDLESLKTAIAFNPYLSGYALAIEEAEQQRFYNNSNKI